MNAALKAELHRQRRAALPPIHPDLTDKRKREYEMLYMQAGEHELFKLREKQQKAPNSTGRFILAAHTEVRDIVMNTGNPLVRVLAIPEVAESILECLEPSIRDITSLAATCRIMRNTISGHCELWDAASGNYITEAFLPKVDGETGQVTINKGIRQPTLVIAPASVAAMDSLSPYADAWMNTRGLRKFGDHYLIHVLNPANTHHS